MQTLFDTLDHDGDGRLSRTDLHRHFASQHLQVVVDLSLCGARLRNYIPSPEFGDASAAASAIAQMHTAGVRVASHVDWQPPGPLCGHP